MRPFGHSRSDLTVASHRRREHFGSRTTICFRSLDRQDTFVNVQAHVVHKVRLNERTLDPGDVVDGRLHLTGLEDENVLTVEALMAYSHDGEGLHRAVDPEDDQVYTYAMTFLAGAPRIFACFDQPDLKAPYRLTSPPPTSGSYWATVGRSVRRQDGGPSPRPSRCRRTSPRWWPVPTTP